MFYLRVLDSEFDDATRRIATMFPQLMDAMEAVLAEQLEVFADQTRQDAASLFEPNDDHAFERTGNLVASIGAEAPSVMGPMIEGYIHAGGDEAPYAKYFLPTSLQGTGGTAPHQITARFAKTLHFFQGGVERFPFSVQHPGFGERDFIEVAYEEWRRSLPAHVQEAVDRVLSGA